jgi:hypothetical protein
VQSRKLSIRNFLKLLRREGNYIFDQKENAWKEKLKCGKSTVRQN